MIKKVLIVDDNSDNLYMLEILLKGYGLEVTSAENGKDALDKARLNPPDLIVTDILMPVMDGFDLCREWKSDDVLKHIPLVFYTATYPESKDEAFALSLGANRFIIKPQEPDIFMNMIKEVLEGKYTSSQAVTKPLGEEMEFFRKHNEILFKKLEKKMLDLEIANQKLKILEENYRLSFENVSDVIFTIDTDLNILSVTPSVERILGYKPGDFVGRPVSDLEYILTPESFEQAVANIGLVLRGEIIPATTYRFIAKDGSIKFGEISGSPLRREGKIIGMISVARDITSRKLAEDALRQSEDKYRSIVEQSIMGIGISKGNQIIFANKALLELYNYEDLEEFKKIPLSDHIAPSSKNLFNDRMKMVAEGKILPQEFECDMICKGGQIKTLYASSVHFSLEGEVLTQTTFQDITERKKMEESLLESEARYRSLFENSADAILLTAPDGHIFQANVSACRMFGGTEAEIIRLGRNGVVDQTDPRLPVALEERKRTGRFSGELTFKRRDGQLFPGEMTSVVFQSKDGLRTCMIIRDITERKQAEEKLRESEKKYRELYDFLPIPVYEMDLEANITSANRAIYETFRGSEEDLKKGFKAWQLLSPEDIEKSRNNIERLLKGEAVEGTEYILKRLDGSFFPAIIISSLIYSNDKPVGLRGAIVDIKEIKQAEEKLQESDERYKALFDRSLDLVYLTDFEGRFIDANPAALNRLGYTKEEIRSLNFASLLSEDQLTLALKTTKEIQESGIHRGLMELRLRHKNGSEVCVETHGSTIMSNGIPVAIQGIARDITERKRIEEELRESEERYRTIIEEIEEGYYETDLAGNYTFVNDSMARTLQYSREELIGMNYRTYIPRDDIERVYQTFNKVYRTGEIIKWFPMINIRKDGTPLFVEDSVSCLRDKEGRIIGFRGISRDITERKQAEEKLNQTLENLRKAMGGIIQVISSTVETKDPYTAGHQRRVADLTWAIAQEMGLSDGQREGLRMAGTIHDLGKISVPAEILSKPTRLTVIENKLIQAHSQIGYDILKGIEFPWPIAEMVLQHHERINGSGYPRGLKGEAISLEARILMVADVVEAMASYRPYRPALGVGPALEEIEKNKGILYDPEVVKVCLRLFREKGFGFE